MPRYGDLDALYVKWMHAAPAQKQSFGEIIEKHQTADVAPRSEVEVLMASKILKEAEIETLKNALKISKIAVAREIFEEIKKYYCINKYGEVVVYIDAIDEIENKYMEENK